MSEQRLGELVVEFTTNADGSITLVGRDVREDDCGSVTVKLPIFLSEALAKKDELIRGKLLAMGIGLVTRYAVLVEGIMALEQQTHLNESADKMKSDLAQTRKFISDMLKRDAQCPLCHDGRRLATGDTCPGCGRCGSFLYDEAR